LFETLNGATVTRLEGAVKVVTPDRVIVPDRVGVVIVGPVASTTAPVPVDEVMEMSGLTPPVDARGEEAVTEFTVPPLPGVAQAGTPPEMVRT
jgi:hypothetical protein